MLLYFRDMCRYVLFVFITYYMYCIYKYVQRTIHTTYLYLHYILYCSVSVCTSINGTYIL